MAKSTEAAQTKAVEATETAEAAEPQTTKRVLAQFVGHEGTTRVIRKADQDFLIGIPGISKEDLVWKAGSREKLDVTEAHEEVQEYLKKSKDFKVTTVEAPVAAPVASE